MTRVEPSGLCGAPVGITATCDLPSGHTPRPYGWAHQRTFTEEEPVTTPIERMDPAAFATVAFDFDGVLHPYSKGWHDGTCYDPPAPGAIETLTAVMATRPVAIMTARPIEPVGDWLDEHAPHLRYVLDQNLYFDHWTDPTAILVTNRKIVAAHYVDDRALRFGPDAMGVHVGRWTEMAAAIAYWDDRNARDHADRQLCTGCGEPLAQGGHGASEYGGCV